MAKEQPFTSVTRAFGSSFFDSLLDSHSFLSLSVAEPRAKDVIAVRKGANERNGFHTPVKGQNALVFEQHSDPLFQIVPVSKRHPYLYL